MAMEISNNYSSYASSYINAWNSRKKMTESSVAKAAAETGSTPQSTVVDVSAVKDGSGKKTNSTEYLSELNRRYSSLNIMAGGVNKNYRKHT